VHERYRRQTDRETTDDRWRDDDIANLNVSSRSLKITDRLRPISFGR